MGVGVDTLHLPRLASLLSRQAARMGSMRGCAAPLGIASQQFARRILHDRELVEWKARFDHGERASLSDVELTWLGAR